jgi:phage tail-like protein
VFDANEAEASVFNRRGELLRTARAIWPTPVAGPDPSKTKSSELDPGDGPSYPESGSWLSKPLDSGIYNCPWHRIEMTLKCLPPGTQVEVRTFAFEQLDMAPVRPDDPRLVEAYTAVAPTQPRPEDRKKERVEEFLIKGGPGRFISVLVILRGDGFGSAVVEGLRLHYPRESYLEYLPPLYSGNEPMRQFLERFLSIFQTEWDEFDRKVEESDRFLDLNAVPEGDAMTYLASWLGLELEGSWKGEQNRQLLRAVPKIFPRRGTLSALQDYVRVYLANIAGLPVEQVAQTSFPAFVEGFRERQYFLLSQPDGSTLGRAKPLWSPGVVKRLQVGVFSREGDVELVSTGDPERDLIHHFAHRFRVYAPAAWVRTAEHETLLRRAIEAEMPGHVTYELCLVEAGVRVGIQSTVGLDTIVGDPPARHLSCKPEEAAASLPTQNRLGEGAALSGRGKGPAVLDTGARVGNWILN